MESVYSSQTGFCLETDGFLSFAAEDSTRSCLCVRVFSSELCVNGKKKKYSPKNDLFVAGITCQ